MAMKAIYTCLLLVLFCSCHKTSPDVNNNGQPPIGASLTGHVNLLLTDYYPDSFYHRYATLDVTADSQNVYFHLGTLNNFTFKNIKIIIGTFVHVKSAISGFTTPPLSDVGPSVTDYNQDYSSSSESSTYDVQVRRSSLPGNNVYIYLWARVEKYSNNALSDWHGCWVYSKQEIDNDAATSYFGYNMP
jgi:hypothetical protein